MRKTFFDNILKHALNDNDSYLLTGDLGFRLFDDFRSNCPGRFIDIGVAESNMIGIAAGLSLSGKKVYCYSIIPFLIMRAFEQIRVDIDYQNLDVKLIGAGGGFTYGLEGFTHFGFEDLSLMRSLQNMTVVVPADPVETELLAELSYDYPHPMYVRLGKSGEPVIHKSTPNFEIGRGMVLSEGNDIVIFAIGSMVHEAIKAVDIIKNHSISAALINIHTLKPLDKDLIKEYSQSHKAVFTIEEHSIVGGLGSAVSEVLSESSNCGVLKRIGMPEKLGNHVGNAEYLKRKYGLTSDTIAATIVNELKEL